MNIDGQLNDLLEKYNMSSDEDSPMNRKERIYNEINCMITQINSKSKIAIRCGGNHTERLVSDFMVKNKLSVQYVIDKSCNEEFITQEGQQIPIISNEQAEEKELDIIIISTFLYREEVLKEFAECKDVQILDIYGELIAKGYLCECEYYNIDDDPYIPSAELECRYRKSQNRKEQGELLRRIIVRYLAIKDFYSALKYLEEYIKKDYVEECVIKAFYTDLKNFLNQIRVCIQSRPQKDIIGFWQDALCHDWVKEMPFMMERQESGIYFENAFTPTVWTRAVYALMLDKYYEVDDFYKWRNAGRQHYLTEFLEKKGYKCLRAGKNDSHDLSKLDYVKDKIIDWEAATPEYYWEILRQMASEHNKNKPLFILAHSAYESHQPVSSPNILNPDKRSASLEQRFNEKGRNVFLEKIKYCLKYLDEQTQFYVSFLGEQAIRIYMSDHGTNLKKEDMRWDEQTTHVNFIIEGGTIAAKKIKKFYSHYYFYDVIKLLLDGKIEALEEILPSEILIQAVDVYSEASVRFHLQLDNAGYCMAFRGIQTETDRYIRMSEGKEYYFILPDEKTNHIGEKQYTERINMLRNKAGNYFINIDKESFFEHSRELYRKK